MAVLERVSYNNAELLRVDSNPSGSVAALYGSLAVLITTGQVYRNTNGGTAWELITTGVGIAPNPQPGTGTSNPAGLDSYIQYNDNGILGADSSFTFNKTTKTLSVTNLSGSLTKLSDGSSYLVAGNNVTIVSGSNGSVVIAATSGGSAAGNNAEIQFNNTGSFGSSTNFTFDSSSNNLSLTGSFGMKGNIIPDADTTYTLGTSEKRWGHIYTGDLHLRNDRGDWTIVEEPDYLCVVNNITGKKYKMMLQPID